MTNLRSGFKRGAFVSFPSSAVEIARRDTGIDPAAEYPAIAVGNKKARVLIGGVEFLDFDSVEYDGAPVSKFGRPTQEKTPAIARSAAALRAQVSRVAQADPSKSLLDVGAKIDAVAERLGLDKKTARHAKRELRARLAKQGLK